MNGTAFKVEHEQAICHIGRNLFFNRKHSPVTNAKIFFTKHTYKNFMKDQLDFKSYFKFETLYKFPF